MKNNYIVHIILPVYNSKDFILDTLNSIIHQTYKNWRLVLIDDNSNDGTSELITDFINNKINKKKIVFIKNNKNKGQAYSRNLALKYCNSEYVAFIDADDLWEKNKLKKQIKYMIDYGYSFTYSDYKTLNNISFSKLKLCEDYYLKCQILKSNNAYKCPGIYSYYRVRDNSLQSNRLKVLLAVWNINKNLNNMNYINNLKSIFLITCNSLKKYAFR